MSERYDAPEPRLAESRFATSGVSEGFEAVAVRLQTLMLTRKGTHPNNPDLGVDIDSYRFESDVDGTAEEIRAETERQIAKWMPGAGPVIVDAEFDSDASAPDGKRLLVRFRIGEDAAVFEARRTVGRRLVSTLHF